MMISSLEMYAQGCDGFEMPFGCEVESDKVAVGDIVISPEGMLAVCGGDKYDECRTCTLSRVFGWNYADGEFNYGDSTMPSVGTNLLILYIQSIALFWLVMTIFVKECVGMGILYQQFMVLGGTSPDVDYVTIGKDCGVALVVLLYVFFFKLKDWHERAFYIARFKQLEEGAEEEEEEEEEEEKEKEECSPKEQAMRIENSNEKAVANKDEDGGLELTAVKIKEDTLESERDQDEDHNKETELEKIERPWRDRRATSAWLTASNFWRILQVLTVQDCVACSASASRPPRGVYSAPHDPWRRTRSIWCGYGTGRLLEGGLGCLFGIYLSRQSRICFSQLYDTSPGATALAMLSLMSGLVDIMTNILDNYRNPRENGAYVPRLSFKWQSLSLRWSSLGSFSLPLQSAGMLDRHG